MVDPVDDSGIRPLIGLRPLRRDPQVPAKRRPKPAPAETEAEEAPKPRRGKRLGSNIDERC